MKHKSHEPDLSAALASAAKDFATNQAGDLITFSTYKPEGYKPVLYEFYV